MEDWNAKNASFDTGLADLMYRASPRHSVALRFDTLHFTSLRMSFHNITPIQDFMFQDFMFKLQLLFT